MTDRTRIELAAFRRLRKALIANHVPHVVADSLAREHVDYARNQWREMRDNAADHFEARGAAAEALRLTRPVYALRLISDQVSRKLRPC